MKTWVKVLIGIGIAGLVIGAPIAYVVSAKFTAAKLENAVVASSEEMQNVHGLTEQLKMQGLTVKNFSETDIKKMELAIKRYEDKPQQLMQWVQENGNQFSPELHSKFMDATERYFVKWRASQKSKISIVQSYRNYLDSSVKGFIATSLFNYPSDKAQKIMDMIIAAESTKQTFETGVMKMESPF